MLLATDPAWVISHGGLPNWARQTPWNSTPPQPLLVILAAGNDDPRALPGSGNA